MPEGKELVKNVKIKGEPESMAEPMQNLVVEKPNKRVFGIWRLHLRMYYLSDKYKFLRKGRENGIWEPPSYVSTDGTELSAKKMESFLQNQGYFNARVKAEIQKKGRKGVKVVYKVQPNLSYQLRDIQYYVEDFDLFRLVMDAAEESKLKKGKRFSSNDFVAERDRLMNLMRRNGYYDFSREFIYFDIDSTIGTREMDVFIGIKNPDRFKRHKVYRIEKVYFDQDFRDLDTTRRDTISVSPGLIRIGEGNSAVDEIIKTKLLFDPGDVYNIDAVQQSLRNFRKLQQYRYVDVNFITKGLNNDTAGIELELRFTPYTRYQFSLQSEVLTSEQSGEGPSFDGRFYGVAGAFTLRDIDFLKRGIHSEIRLRVATEFSANQFENVLFNNLFTLSNSYYFSRPFLSFLLPKKLEKRINQSNLSLQAFLESNPDFQRQTASLNAGYTMDGEKVKHYLLPFEFNLVRTNIISDAFQTRMDTSSNLVLRNLFANHTIANGRWGLFYSSKKLGSRRNYFELNANMLKSAGALFWVFSQFAGKPVEGDLAATFDRNFLGMQYFQYLKGDYDFRFHQRTFWSNEIVYRIFLGMIYPYGNTATAVPFEKRYYSGGSTSIRGWGIRQLGPGTFRPDADNDFVFFHSGDIKLEANFEYRFDISGLLKMAVFADAGNIWNHPSNNFQVQGGAWDWNTFYKELAVAGGLGMRFDFTYFIFRTDIGIPMRDPSVVGTAGEKWFPEDYYRPFRFGRVVRFNFGIGYPF